MATIKLKRSVIPACDVDSLEKLEKLVKETCKVKGVGAYKVGFSLALPFGLKAVIKIIRKHTDLPIIYDHQKAATDIPELGEKFMKAIKGVDYVILFPMAGPVTEERWIKAARKEKINIIVGGEMTHKAYLTKNGGFIDNYAPKKIFKIAVNKGIMDFVVPGNKPYMIEEYKRFLESFGIKPIFYSPGLIAQGGSLTEGAKAAGENWHAIVGRGIYEAKDIKKAAEEMAREIV
ncbi:orotidine 5'-phosphate decarboxylase [Candidatus Woesearchaeota archaeon]|nr:orotidine 5'-phosphate decarboxylase [Candidatus Woesearchaeota archaeon]